MYFGYDILGFSDYQYVRVSGVRALTYDLYSSDKYELTSSEVRGHCVVHMAVGRRSHRTSAYPRSLYRARQLYKNISMLFLFPVKDGKLSTCVSATFNASCYG